MVSKAVVTLLLASASPTLAQQIDDVPEAFLKENAPYGFDVTPDGHIWINLGPYGQQDDYAALATDMMKRNAYGSTVWVRGYHKRNPKVAYRETKTRYNYDCKARTYYQDHRIAYSANGTVLFDTQYRQYPQPIIPGSAGETWIKIICPK